MFATSRDQLRITDSLLTITDAERNSILADCTAGLQLTNGVNFRLEAMETIHHATEFDASVTGGGDAVLPRIEWQIKLINAQQVSLSLTVTNTTNQPLAIERIDILDCPTGYRRIPVDELYLRQTGWQSFSPASVQQTFAANDPWLQPPLYAPMTLPSNSDRRSIAWMTILRSANVQPLLIGFGSAKNYLGMLEIADDHQGHNLAAANYIEGVELMPGTTITSEPLLLMWGKDQESLLENYGTQVATNMSARRATIPVGWCSWNYYFHKVTEQDVIDNITVIQNSALPFEYIQLDDGYQTKLGDWLSINEQQFPSGMKYLADTIRSAGYKPGIWAAPFMAQENSEVFEQHPNWFIHDANGRPFNVNRHGDQYWPTANYGLDLTHPDAYAWVKNVLTTICQTWGYDYLKLDFLYAACQRGVRYDPTYTSVQAFRRGLEMIREVAGERYLLGCGAPLLPSVGIFDAMRISADIMPSLPKNDKRSADVTRPLSRDNIASLWSHAWMNGHLWVNDPDTVRVRQHEIDSDWEAVKALASLVALTGGSMMDSDNLASLEADGMQLMRRLLPVAAVKTKAVGSQLKRPAMLTTTVQQGDGRWSIIAKYNWTKQPQSFRFVARDWGLPIGRYHIYDLINQKYLGMNLYQRSMDIAASGVGLLSACPVRDRPQVIASKHHILGPVGDVSNVNWDNNRLIITITPGHQEPVEVLVHVPMLLYKLLSHTNCRVVGTSGPKITIAISGKQASLLFKHRLDIEL